jgi:hypothetical protein
LTSGIIQLIENISLKRQKGKKKRKVIGYQFENQVIKERRKCIYSKYSAQPLDGSFSESTVINFQDEIIPVACSCFSLC